MLYTAINMAASRGGASSSIISRRLVSIIGKIIDSALAKITRLLWIVSFFFRLASPHPAVFHWQWQQPSRSRLEKSSLNLYRNDSIDIQNTPESASWSPQSRVVVARGAGVRGSCLVHSVVGERARATRSYISISGKEKLHPEKLSNRAASADREHSS